MERITRLGRTEWESISPEVQGFELGAAADGGAVSFRRVNAPAAPPPLSGSVQSESPTATLDLPVFRHMEYKDKYLWGKPILTFEYPVAALPSDEVLLRDLEFLATCVNSASSIT